MSYTGFSVLMSIYKNEKAEFFKEAMHSIINQTLPANEIILVIDGLVGTTLQNQINESKKQLGDVFRTVQLPENQGLGKALNEGLTHCTYDIVIRMDTDDICKPNRFEKLIEEFERQPDVDVVGSWIEEFHITPNDYKKQRKVEQHSLDIKRRCQSRNPMNHPSVAFKKCSVLKVGGYLHFPLLEDYFLWYRMLQQDFVFYNIQESLVYLRIGNDMIGRRWGWTYFSNECKFFMTMLDNNFIGVFKLSKNLLIRLPLRTLPKPVLNIFYRNFLRT